MTIEGLENCNDTELKSMYKTIKSIKEFKLKYLGVGLSDNEFLERIIIEIGKRELEK
jgi:hypothetical protein